MAGLRATELRTSLLHAAGLSPELRNNALCFFFILHNEPTNAQLIGNLLYCFLLHCSYMFQHYCVILRELVVSTVQLKCDGTR